MNRRMKYVTTINPTIHEWKSNDPNVITSLIVAYVKLINDNKLNPHNYNPVLGEAYENDDYVKNRITLVLEAVKIIPPEKFFL